MIYVLNRCNLELDVSNKDNLKAWKLIAGSRASLFVCICMIAARKYEEKNNVVVIHL